MPDPALPDAVRRLIYGYDRDFPLEAASQVMDASDELLYERFEITSRFDQRVPGLIVRDASASGRLPAVLFAHPATLHKGDLYVLLPAEEWARRGGVAVLIDQAGHGERTPRPIDIAAFHRYPFRRLDESVQTAVDWMRTVDYLLTRPDVDPARIGFVGFSMGGVRGAAFVGLDERVRAAVFCITGAWQAPSEPIDTRDAARATQAIWDPGAFGPLMAGRPTLIVAGRRDDVVPPEGAQRFFDAMADPKEIAWLECGHWDFMPQGLAPVWPFLHRHLRPGE